MEPKTVLITGVSSGIGRATAKLLDERGFRVFGSVRKSADAESVASELSSGFVPLIMDLGDTASITASLQTVESHLAGRGLDGLVNNAGTISSQPLETLDLDEFRKLLEVNVTAQLAVTQTYLPLIRKARGRIVNMGSVSGISALPMIGPYCASKFAMEALTDTLRMELSPWGIHVAIIEPGSASTAIMSRAHESGAAFGGESGHAGEYNDMLHGMQAGFDMSARRGIPPEKVAARVYHALTSKRPKTRYLVGRMAYIRSIARLLPDRTRDQATLRTLRRQARAGGQSSSS